MRHTTRDQPGEAKTFRGSGVVDPGKVRVVANGIDPAPFTDMQSADLQEFGLDTSMPTAAIKLPRGAVFGEDRLRNPRMKRIAAAR